jgi:4-amino-4-deoxy-L-arabinose transferase-like glycosyltransferase
MAQTARNIAQGQGYVTNVIYPLSWSLFPRVEGHPEFQFPPLYPHLVAACFIVVGIKSYVPLLVSGTAYLFGGLVFYCIVERLFNRQAAFFSTLMYVTYYYLVLMGVMGRTESTYILLVLASILVVLWGKKYPYILGGLSGFAYLTRFNHWFFLLPILGVLLWSIDRNRLRYCLKFFGAMLLVLSPYWIRNITLIGSPFYHHQIYELVSDTPYFPAFAINTTFSPPDPFWFALTHPRTMLLKWIQGLEVVYRSVPRLLTQGWIVLVLAIAQLVTMKWEKWSQNIKKVSFIFLTAFVLQALLLSFVRARARYYIPFLPLVFVFAGAKLEQILRKRGNILAMALLVSVLVINLSFSLRLNPSSQRNIDELAQVRATVPAGKAILTNVPQVLAWATDRPALAMVPYREAVTHYSRFDYVFLSKRPEALHSRQATQKFLRNRQFRETFTVIESYPEAEAKLFQREK